MASKLQREGAEFLELFKRKTIWFAEDPSHYALGTREHKDFLMKYAEFYRAAMAFLGRIDKEGE